VKVGSKILLAGSLLLLALAPTGVFAAHIKTQPSSQYLWYKDPFQEKSQGGLLRHVKFNATKIDDAGRFSTVGNGRVSKQFGSSGEGRIGATLTTSSAGSAFI
jgi:hypothetical protein